MIIGDENSGGTHLLLCELQELQEGTWYEKARWVRFEEDVEEGGGRWSKPFVATIALHALFDLRRCLADGVVELGVECLNYTDLTRVIVDSLVNNNLIDSTKKEQVRNTLNFRHVHQHEHVRSIKRGLSEIGKKLSSTDHANSAAQGIVCGLGASAAIAGGIAGVTGLQPTINRTTSHKEHYMNEHFAKKLAPGCEASATLVAGVDFLVRPVSVFLRLSNDVMFDNLIEVAIPTRFVFVLLGPSNRAKEFREIGRAMSTVMSDDIFRDVAYRGVERNELLLGFDEFLAEVTILPPGEWDPTIRIQPPKTIPSEGERKMKALSQIQDEEKSGEKLEKIPSAGGLEMRTIAKSPSNSSQVHELLLKSQKETDEQSAENSEPVSVDPALQRTGQFFGGLVQDVKRKAPHYLSDITDGFNIQCLASIFFIFFACLSPIVTFGGLLGVATENHMAAFEAIITAAICGTTYHLFAGQPLTILGSTGPVLLFEKILFQFSQENGIDYLSFRFWIGMSAGTMLLLLVAFDLSALVQLITRFTEECFATLISVIFIFESIVAVYGIYKDTPPTSVLNSYDCTCERAKNSSSLTIECNLLNSTACKNEPNCLGIGDDCNKPQPVPDVFFFSCLLFIGTCSLSFFLKNFRTSSFFTNKVGICFFLIML